MMKKKLQFLAALTIMGAAVTFTSCSEDEVVAPVVAESNNITSNTTWTKNNVYTIDGRVSVVSGVTLTIEAGTVIKARAGSGANASALVVARGAKIRALGTATEPIIFTSESDLLVSGNIASPNLASNVNGLWGGVIILGNARASFGGNATEQAIEGIPATDANGKFGGTDDADNSGVFTYVSIRHGGANIGEGNEINGLTLGAVGTGTVISNIEIIGNQDDGVEFFGGSVNVSNVVVWNNGDDAIDTDMAWSGTLNNVVIINPGDEAFELDGPEGDYNSAGHTITNGTVFAVDGSGLVDLDDNSDVNMTNMLFTNLKAGQTVSGWEQKEGQVGYGNNTNGFVSSNWQAIIPAGTTKEEFFLGSADIVEVVTVPTTGADVKVFAGWSWTAIASGKF